MRVRIRRRVVYCSLRVAFWVEMVWIRFSCSGGGWLVTYVQLRVFNRCMRGASR